MLQVAMHNIMKACHAHEPEDFASSCLLSVQREAIGNCGESDLSVKCLENWVFVACTCPTKPLPPSCHPYLFPPLLATLITHSVAVLLGRPCFLYFNICSLSWMKNWKCIYNQRFDLPPYQLPHSSLFMYFWQASCNKFLIWWVKSSPQAKQWAELRTGWRIY